MGRTRRNVYAQSSVQHYLVLWDLQWRVIHCRRLSIGCDLREALMKGAEEFEEGGWRAEGSAQFGFTFLTRADERRLLAITARDPFNATAQSFSPFERDMRA
jgi:hypothetical protein